MFAASKTDGSSELPDQQFNYVTMLLHGDGTNGAQNNTFLDSSTNNFTITRNGNTTQGSFSPYGSNWSNYFGGAGNYITVSSTLALSTSDYTIEFWFSGSRFEVSWGNSGGYSPFSINASGDIYFANSSNNAWIYNLNNFIIANGTWNHYAIVRNSGVVYLYRNGVQVGTSSAPSSSSPNGNVVIGYYNNGAIGYASNFRCVIGTAVYTSAFTPSTAPLTAITNTQLLTCQSNGFKDNSTNNYALTVTGAPSVQRFNPFGTSTAYSTSVIGGSGYFDGDGDRLTVPDNTAFDLGSGDFTIEAWVYQTASNETGAGFINQWVTTGSLGWYFGTTTTNQFVFAWTTNGSTIQAISNSSPITLNTWTHYAATRSGTTGRIFINGVQAATATLSGTIFNNSSVVTIGNNPNGSGSGWHLFGYMTDARVIKGTALYTSAFTPPTAPLTAITNTSLLLNYTNGAIFDNAMINNLETVGAAQISTSVVKYGTGSLYMNASTGNTDYFVQPATNSVNFGTGNFTIEFWMNPLFTNTSWGASSLATIMDTDAPVGTDTSWWVVHQNDASIMFASNSAVVVLSSAVLSANVWQHVAIVRNGSTITIYVNGTSAGSTTYGTTIGSNRRLTIGTQLGSSRWYKGYLDDIRITNGYARYTANFTPPIVAFPNIGPY